MTDKKRVLILCTGNVARSQMAEGLLRHIADDRFEVFSAGSVPSYVRPNSITVMNELGIDISHHRSKSLTEFLETQFDYVITVCDHASEHCPIFPGPANANSWSIDDPWHPVVKKPNSQPFAAHAMNSKKGSKHCGRI